MNIEIRGEQLLLLPERAVYWPRAKALLIADMHCGKAATFRAHGVPVPDGNMEADLARLTRVLAATNAQRLIILGDWIHARAGCTDRVIAAVSAWRAQHHAMHVLWIRGNHDTVTHARFGFEETDEAVHEGPFRLQHKPDEDPQHYTIAGHIHPVFALRFPGSWAARRLPCFHFRKHGATLPAFGSFTGGAEVTAKPGDRLFLATGDSVLEWTSRPPGL